jgi:hypothetical protein
MCFCSGMAATEGGGGDQGGTADEGAAVPGRDQTSREPMQSARLGKRRVENQNPNRVGQAAAAGQEGHRNRPDACSHQENGRQPNLTAKVGFLFLCLFV